MRSVQLLLTAILLGTVAPVWAADEEDVSDQPVFFPAPPNEPKLQFLRKFSSALDVTTSKKGFRDFVFGGEDKESQLVEKPYGAAIYGGALYVVDTRGNGYAVFDIANDDARFVRPTGAGALKKPINITIDTDGTKYVTDTGREQVVVFDAKDRFLRAFGEPEQFKPVDVAVKDNRLYVTDIMRHQIHVLDKTTGETIMLISEPGRDPGQLFHPTNLTIAPDGTIYVADTTNFRLQQFDADGQFIRTVGESGTRPGKFSRPKGVAVDKEGNIYVVDAAFENIQILAPDGGARMAFGSPGAEPYNFNLPTVVKVDYDNVSYFEQYAAPGWEIDYLVIVANQYGLNKVIVFGFGHNRD